MEDMMGCSPVSNSDYIYIRTVSYLRLFATLLIELKLVHGPFGRSNMHSTLDFCPRPAMKETNVPLLKIWWELTVLIYIPWSNSELMELSEPDHRRGSNGVAPVLPSINRGWSKLPSWEDLGHFDEPKNSKHMMYYVLR